MVTHPSNTFPVNPEFTSEIIGIGFNKPVVQIILPENDTTFNSV